MVVEGTICQMFMFEEWQDFFFLLLNIYLNILNKNTLIFFLSTADSYFDMRTVVLTHPPYSGSPFRISLRIDNKINRSETEVVNMRGSSIS